MKKIQLCFMALLVIGAVACEKTYYGDPRINRTFSGFVTVDDAANMVAGAISSDTYGVAGIVENVTLGATRLANSHQSCGTHRADTISQQSPSGSLSTYNYHQTYDYMVYCNTSSQPDSLFSGLVYNGSFSNANLSSTNSGSSILHVGGLLSSDTTFVIKGEYKQGGSFMSKIDTANKGSNNIDIKIAALTLKKPSRVIASGTSTIAITGSSPKKGSFSYTGTMLFNGDGTATLTLNGAKYTLNLRTGWLTKI